jgi:hypothetical protein
MRGPEDVVRGPWSVVSSPARPEGGTRWTFLTTDHWPPTTLLRRVGGAC